MNVQKPSIAIPEQEYQNRLAGLREHITELGATGCVLFDRDYILYYTGFSFIPTERPMAFLLHAEGETALFVPRLEVEHAKTNAHIDQVHHYVEYPDDPHPMTVLRKACQEMGYGSTIAVDDDGYPWIFGYQGPSISELTSAEVLHIRAFIEAQMMIKSPNELALIRESIRWANLAHTLLQRYTRAGESETEVSERASSEANAAMLDAIGPIYRSLNAFESSANAGYRGQIGRNAAIPHALAANLTFQPGDVLVTGASAPVWGYVSELERTMILGEPSEEQKTFFEHMLALQDLAFNTMGPGVMCSEVDKVVRAYYEKHDLLAYWKHHTGHAIGLRYHEGPFFDIGDHTVLQPGMVMTVEPGLYTPKLGGFRHSDTVAITEDGIELLTYYPRDLESLTLPL